MPLIDESSTEIEGKGVRAVDDKEKACEPPTMPNGGLGINHAGTLDVLVIEVGQEFLSSESLGSSDSRDDLLSESSSFRNMLEGYSISIEGTSFTSEGEKTYCIYLETNLFMIAPVMPMHGRIEDIAKARRHDRIYARMKPVMNEKMKPTTRATFSDIPCCTKSIC
jgi:hypothetical protein